MSLDLTTLRLLKYRDRYERLARSVPTRALDTRTAVILSDIGRYFREFPESNKLDLDAFRLLFASIHKTLKDEEFAIYGELFKKIVEEDVSPEIEAGLMPRLVASAAAVDLADVIAKYTAGEEIDIRQATQQIVDQYDQMVDRKVKNPQVLDPIEDLLKAEENDTGLPWPLECLRQHIKPLSWGTFVVVAARPDKGKTTFCSHTLTHMAPHLDEVWPGEQRSILWLNNEGPGKEIVKRCFQSALDATIEDLVKLNAEAPQDPKHKTKLREDYINALGGRGGALRIFDVHGMTNVEVEDLIRTHKPGLVLFDMIDNINFLGMTNNNGQRTDQLLESMYQWARMLGVKYETAIMATSQISADGDGERWPTLPMLKDSKTGKQGAADVIITIGTINDETMASYRYIGTTKNKKKRTGVSSNPMATTTFDGDRGRYKEVG